MRALIVSPFYPPHPGGIERYSFFVAKELRSRGWDVDVVHSTNDGPAVGRGDNGEHLHGVRSWTAFGRLPFPSFLSTANRRSLDAVLAQPFDFVLIQSHLFMLGVWVARRLGGHPEVVWLNHGSGHVPTSSRIVNRLVAAYEHVNAWLLRRSVKKYASVSAESAAWMQHLGARDAVAVGNAVEPMKPRESRPPSGPLRLAFVGRLEPRKGAIEAIELVKALPDLDLDLTIAGDGGDRPVVEMAAEGCPRVHLLGSVSSDQVKELLASSDLFVYPSQYPEGFPTVLLEAGAAGCPVLSFPVAGVRELLAHGGGWIVDDLGEAQSVIRTLAEDPQHAAASGRQLQARVGLDFTWRAVVDRLLRLVD